MAVKNTTTEFYRKQRAYRGPRIDLSGRRFGRLSVLSCAGRRTTSRDYLWNCTCDCGNKSVVAGSHLKTGHTKSCGCFMRESSSVNSTTHGLSHTRTYRIYKLMLVRCSGTAERYKDYSGRGISVCKRWLTSFENFVTDMGMAPDDMEIDRKNGDGNYEPSNCRWATRTQQSRNRRNNIVVKIDGRKHCLSEWCEIFGLNYRAIYYRWRRGVRAIPELFKPVRQR